MSARESPCWLSKSSPASSKARFLLVAEAATQKHLEILSEIAELLSDASLRERLKASVDAAELHGMIAGWQSTQAA